MYQMLRVHPRETRSIELTAVAVLGTLIGAGIAGAWATTVDVVDLIRRALDTEASIERDIAETEQRLSDMRARLEAIRAARADVETAT